MYNIRIYIRKSVVRRKRVGHGRGGGKLKQGMERSLEGNQMLANISLKPLLLPPTTTMQIVRKRS
jgi:hypothetical protein